MKKKIFAVLLVIIFACSNLMLGFTSGNDNLEPPANASYKEFKRWFNNNYDEYREISGSFWSKDDKVKVIIEDARLEYLTNLGYDATINSSGTPTVIRGDILVTDRSKNVGIRHGHAALVQDESFVIEIFGKDSNDPLMCFVPIEPYWFGKVKDHLAVLYPRNWTPQQATDARDWELARALTGSVYYYLNNDIYGLETTYCSKSPWQAWYYGAGRVIAQPLDGYVFPKMLYDSTELRRAHDTGLW